MFYLESNRPPTWAVHTSLVTYTIAGAEYCSNPAIYTDNPIYKDVVVDPVILTDEQQQRLDRVKYLVIGKDALTAFILTGEIIDPQIKPLADIAQAHKAQDIILKYVDPAKVDPATYTELTALFPSYAVGTFYILGAIVVYNGELFKVLQSHAAQLDWVPATTAALYVRIPPPGVIPDWTQPSGAQDDYNIGDRVRFDGHVYESKIDANVWSPAVYPGGWLLIT